MKINKPLLILCIAIPLLVGVVSALLSGGGMEVFASVNKPPLAPPAWLFPVAWTILYTLMGISTYLILTSEASAEAIQEAMNIYTLQLLVNFLWPTFFFNFKWYLFAFFWLVLLWLLVLLMFWKFKDISKLAALLNIPYLLWLTFAGYLNFSIWLLNRSVL
ncbi:MAG: tryptophan-rich sensory protein [Lachnospiraceae bacterium]|nr:tryptophan-rich sensory protein [Lachnospiraceae bacterium]